MGLVMPIATFVTTSRFILGESRLGFARLGEGEPEGFKALRGEQQTHTRDALVADTARKEGAAFVTSDKRLTSAAGRLGIVVLTPTE